MGLWRESAAGSEGLLLLSPRQSGGAWGRWPAGLFSIRVQMGRETKPAQPVASPGRLSIARWIGREVAGLSRYGVPALTRHARTFW